MNVSGIYSSGSNEGKCLMHRMNGELMHYQIFANQQNVIEIDKLIAKRWQIDDEHTAQKNEQSTQECIRFQCKAIDCRTFFMPETIYSFSACDRERLTDQRCKLQKTLRDAIRRPAGIEDQFFAAAIRLILLRSPWRKTVWRPLMA